MHVRYWEIWTDGERLFNFIVKIGLILFRYVKKHLGGEVG